jgi:2-phosphoglycerate kinase
MRGILVQSLVYRGVPFETALEIANSVRERVSDREEIEVEELGHLIEELLSSSAELEILPPPPAKEPSLVLGANDSSTPFSKGLLSVSLEGAGLDPSDAHDVARELEARLLLEGRREIERSELRTLVSETLEKSHGSRAAQRYRRMRAALADSRPLLILVGGAAGVGKTSIAVEVARRLEITRLIGTDSIRQIMRLMFSPDLMPEIHCSTYDAHTVLEPSGAVTGDPVIAGFREQVQKIAVGVHALLDRAVAENTSLLIEGANLLPGVIDLERYRKDARVVFLVTAALDVEAFRARFTSRARTARERPSDRYLQHLDDILAIQQHVLAEADRLDLPIIDNVHFDDTVVSVIRSVIAALGQSMASVSSE